MTPDQAAWDDLCARLAELGARLQTSEFPGAPEDRADGYAHLAQQLLCWTGWSLFHADPRRPSFQRQNDLITQWGGPNADNVYRHARVEAGRRYRLHGRMHACEEFILAIRAGFMHEPTWGTLLEITATELGIGEGDEFDLVLGEGGPVALPEGAATVSIREYYFDWRPEEPATFTIECLDDDVDGSADRLTPEDLAPRLARAIAGTEHSIEYWNTYMRERRAEAPPNTFAPPLKLAKGLDAARYGFCFWDLAPGDALVVDTDVPGARYWTFQLYELGWFELVDTVERQTSLNHTQLAVDADGRVRVVVSHEDPGVANWLDAGGRTNGLLTFRWFWPERDPTPTASVVPLAEVARHLPPDTTTVDATTRAATLRRRREHLAWRFRT
jgi:hypothetical protein